MKIEEISQFKYTGSSQYPLDDFNYIVAVKEDSSFSNKNIIPLFYITDDYQVLDIDTEELGEKIIVLSTQYDTQTEEIATRFYKNELFKIFKGPLTYNDRHEVDPNIPKSKIYKNYLQPIPPNDIIEIIESQVDIKKSRIKIKDKELKELINNRYLQTDQILFTIYENNIIGPFNLTGSDDDGYYIVEKSALYKFGVYDIKDEEVIEIGRANGVKRSIISDPRVITNSYLKDFDFISDTDLISWFDSELTNKSKDLFNRGDLALVIEKIDKAKNTIEIIESRDRYDRIFKILSETRELIFSKQSLFNALPEFQIVKSELENLEKRKLNITNETETRKLELELTQKNISEKEIEKNILEKKLSELRNQQTEEQNKIRDNIKHDIAELEKQKGQLDAEIETERQLKSQVLEGLKKDIEYSESRQNELKTAIKTLQKDFTTEQNDAQEALKELVKQNTYFNFISGRDLNAEKIKIDDYPSFEIDNGKSLTDYKNVRDQISSILKKQQRHFENHFIDNILICIHQNTLTLFAGLPGTGKTSLAKIISSALAPVERIKEIPVARGWTSQKDLIGFSNPLSKKFHESQTGLYQLLKQLDSEWSKGFYLKSPLAYIILDEANLSPLEHYWSIFYNATDSFASEGKPLTINLGQSEIINHANQLRFIGTINYDQTTEELSPRILDRTNVIRLMPTKQMSNESYSISEIESLSLSFKEIIEIFNLNDFVTESQSIQLSAELNSKFEELKEIFQKLNIYISPRVETGIKRYCKVASKFMTEESRPLDYCIAQRLLPLINIQGSFKNELEQLMKLIKSFNLDDSVSESILKNILEIGSRPGFTQENFNYFLTLTNV